jgi:hypothetical protein
VAKRWREAVANNSPIDSLARTMILHAVDSAIFNFLEAIDQEVLQLTFKASNGVVVDLSKVGGEFAGWYVMSSSDSWRHRYSKKAVIDY